jgi:mannose-1-phosphate guanylyltransferase/phosphomannomutase
MAARSSSPTRIRRAVILAAGKSTRLEGLKLGKPKPAIEVRGQPLLLRHLEQCAQAGIDEVFINLHHLPEQIRVLAGDGSRWNLKITYRFEQEPAGTAGGVKGFAEHLRGQPFLVIYGDNYCTFGLDEIIEAHFRASPPPDMSIVLFELENVSQSGVAVCGPDGMIRSFIEKPGPNATDSHWVNAGIYLLEPNLLDLIPDRPSDFGYEVIPAYLAAGKRILGVKTTGRVYAVDTPELLRQATQHSSTP